MILFLEYIKETIKRSNMKIQNQNELFSFTLTKYKKRK